jgi:competence protein ComEC
VLHKEIPFLRIGLPICAGIISGLYFKPDIHFLLLIAVIILSGFIISLYFNKYQTNVLFGLTMTLTLFIFGLFIYSNEKNSLSVLARERTAFLCTVSDYPVEKGNSIMLTVNLNRKITAFDYEAVNGSMVLYNSKDSTVASLIPGDILVIKCTPAEISNRNNPCEFDYKFYMENHGIKYYAFTKNGDIIRHYTPSRRKLIHNALIIREKIIGMYEERGITGERLALVAAITLGQKSMLDPDQKQNFIRAGVMHIMAVSGLHAVILSLFVFNLLFFMKGRFNILRILITILILWSFAFVTGLTPSVLRATLMFTFIQAGNLMQRRVNGINSVLASAFVLILIRPSVIFDAGFLLSYSAVIYIISFYQDLYMKLQFRNWLTDKVWQSAVVTIVAQAGTLSLTVMLFNRFPTYFILTNIIIVPLSSLLIVIGCLLPVLYPIHFLSKILAVILNNLTGLTEYFTAKAASLPWSNIENIGMTPIECILLTVFIFLSSYFLIKKQSISVILPALLILLYTTAGTLSDISVRKTNELIVYNTPGSSTVGIRAGKILFLYSDTSLMRPEVIRHSATLGLHIRANTLRNKYYCIKTGEKKVLICSSPDNHIIENLKPDIVIFTGLKPQIDKNLTFRQPPEAIIFTSETSSYYSLPKQVNLSGTDTIHFVRKSGSYIKSL